jgi:hypothetical protein
MPIATKELHSRILRILPLGTCVGREILVPDTRQEQLLQLQLPGKTDLIQDKQNSLRRSLRQLHEED